MNKKGFKIVSLFILFLSVFFINLVEVKAEKKTCSMYSYKTVDSQNMELIGNASVTVSLIDGIEVSLGTNHTSSGSEVGNTYNSCTSDFTTEEIQNKCNTGELIVLYDQSGCKITTVDKSGYNRVNSTAPADITGLYCGNVPIYIQIDEDTYILGNGSDGYKGEFILNGSTYYWRDSFFGDQGNVILESDHVKIDASNGCPENPAMYCEVANKYGLLTWKMFAAFHDSYYVNSADEEYSMVCVLVTEDMIEKSKTIKKVDIQNIDQDTGEVKINCEDFSVLHTIYKIILILAPVIVILLGSIDYARAVIASDEEKMTKVKKKFPIRVVLLVVLFLVPLIIKLIISFNPSLSSTAMDCIVNGVSDDMKLNSQEESSTIDSNSAPKNNQGTSSNSSSNSSSSNSSSSSSSTNSTTKNSSSLKDSTSGQYGAEKATKGATKGSTSSSSSTKNSQSGTDSSNLRSACQNACKQSFGGNGSNYEQCVASCEETFKPCKNKSVSDCVQAHANNYINDNN